MNAIKDTCNTLLNVNLRFSEIFGDVYYNKGKKLGR